MDVAKTDLEKNIYKYKEDIKNNNYNELYILFKEILNVLVELKKENLYHLDIKPCNILMSERNVNLEELE